MCIELVDAGASLETEDVDIVVFSCQCKAFLATELACDTNATITNEETFLR